MSMKSIRMPAANPDRAQSLAQAKRAAKGVRTCLQYEKDNLCGE